MVSGVVLYEVICRNPVVPACRARGMIKFNLTSETLSPCILNRKAARRIFIMAPGRGALRRAGLGHRLGLHRRIEFARPSALRSTDREAP